MLLSMWVFFVDDGWVGFACVFGKFRLCCVGVVGLSRKDGLDLGLILEY